MLLVKLMDALTFLTQERLKPTSMAELENKLTHTSALFMVPLLVSGTEY